MLQTDCRAWLAEENAQDMGFAIANATNATIFVLFVQPEYQERGVGRALIQAAEAWMWRQV